MTTKKLQAFFESKEFNVYLFEQDNEQCAELESWTVGGVDMIISLVPFTKENFIEYVNDFDIDEEIELNRQNEAYRKAFTISQSVTDFTNYFNELDNIKDELEIL